MWTGIIGAITALLSAIPAGIKFATEWLAQQRDKLLLALGGERQRGKDLQGRIDGLKEGNKAREQARRDIERNASGGGIMSDDGFRRADEDGDD
jgi:hypothetical protein